MGRHHERIIKKNKYPDRGWSILHARRDTGRLQTKICDPIFEIASQPYYIRLFVARFTITNYMYTSSPYGIIQHSHSYNKFDVKKKNDPIFFLPLDPKKYFSAYKPINLSP